MDLQGNWLPALLVMVCLLACNMAKNDLLLLHAESSCSVEVNSNVDVNNGTVDCASSNGC